MEDPLSSALDEAPRQLLEPAPDVVDQHTSHPRGVHDILNDVKEQALAAFALPFFDGGTGNDSCPIIKVGVAEAGTVHISAHRIDPPYHAEVTLYVRSDVDAASAGRYQIRGRCEMSSDVEEPAPHRDFAVGLVIGDDGSLTIDVAQLRAEMAQAIRAFGNLPS